MNTDAVMCMALTRQMPSLILLSRKAVSTCGVMFRNARRVGTSNDSSLRKLFMVENSDCAFSAVTKQYDQRPPSPFSSLPRGEERNRFANACHYPLIEADERRRVEFPLHLGGREGGGGFLRAGLRS